MNFLLTSGGTSVPIDDVRSITNLSTGNFGCKLATQILLAGHKLRHIHAANAPTPFEFKVNLLKPHQDYVSQLDGLQQFSKQYMKNYSHEKFTTFAEYHIKVMGAVLNFKFDCVILCAAVSDFIVDPVDGKISSKYDMNLEFKNAPKILDIVRGGHDGLLVGFKLVSNDSIEHLHEKAWEQTDRGSDIVIGNRLEDIQSAQKSIYFITKDYSINITGESKDIAAKIITMIGNHLNVATTD